MRGWRSRRVVGYSLAATGLVVAGFAASALAGTIHGTARADTLRGTPKADTIYGLAGNDAVYGLGGNDKLYGGAGNDRLFGGPGNDTIWGGTGTDVIDCGAGTDTVYADAGSKVHGNCEVVHRTDTPPPPPPPPTTTTAPPPPPPPPTTTTTSAAQVEQGHYCGFTNNGGGICFDVTGSPVAWTNGAFELDVPGGSSVCSPSTKDGWVISFTMTGMSPLAPDGSFSFHADSGNAAGSVVVGTVAANGTASGTLTEDVVFTDSGTTYTCSASGTWSATKQS